MATYSFKAIWDAIYSKMLEIKDVRVWWVYNYDIKVEDGISFPAVVITPNNGSISYLDSCFKENNLTFTIRVIDRIQDWIAVVEDNIRELADIVLTKLDELWTITWSNNNWYTVNVDFNYNWWFADTQEPLRVFEIECLFRAVQS